MKITFTRFPWPAITGPSAAYHVNADGVHVGSVGNFGSWVAVHVTPDGIPSTFGPSYPTRAAAADSVIDRYTAPRAA